MKAQRIAQLVRTLGSLTVQQTEITAACGELHRRGTDDGLELVAAALEERVPSLVLERLVAWERQNTPLMSPVAVDGIWTSAALRRLWHGLHTAYLQQDEHGSGTARLHAALRESRSTIVASMLSVMRCLAATATPALVLKGCALLPRYGRLARDLSDVDLLVPDATAGWQVSRSLARLGYSVTAADVSRRAPQVVGLKIDLGHPLAAGVDIHCGSFDMLGNAYLDIPIWQRATSASLAGQDFAVPSAEDTLLVLAAHRAREGSIHLRDVNDTFVLARERGLDWNYVSHAAEDNGLAEVLNLLLQEVRRAYPELEPPTLRKRRRVTTALVRLMSRPTAHGFTWTAPVRSVPYRAFATFDIQRRRHGWRWALPHVLATTLVDVEKHLAWTVNNDDRGVARHVANALRRPAIRLLSLWPWTLSAPPAWTSIRLKPIEQPISRRFRIQTDADVRLDIAELRPEITYYDGMIAAVNRHRHQPDLLVGEGGVFYSTGYASAYPYDPEQLRRMADHITARLLTAGAIETHHLESTTRSGG